MNAKITSLLIALILSAAGTAPRADAAARASAPPGFTFQDWMVTTDGQIDWNYQSGAFNTPNHILLTRPGDSIEANSATGNFKTHQATLQGNVVLRDMNGVLTGFAGQGASHVPATLTCENLQIDGVSKTYTATGNVFFSQGGRSVRADRAIMNGATHDIHLYGHVQLKQ